MTDKGEFWKSFVNLVVLLDSSLLRVGKVFSRKRGLQSESCPFRDAQIREVNLSMTVNYGDNE